MKKRLTAWLLVFCMALSLLPGTAFAAEGGGDGTVTITYDLNDGISDYQLQLKTTPGQEPANSPGAKWAGRPFAGWSSDKAGKVAPDYNKDTTLYAQWLSGYKVTLDFDIAKTGTITLPAGSSIVLDNDLLVLNTNDAGMVEPADLADIQKIIEGIEKTKDNLAFGGWYTDQAFRNPFDLSDTIETNGIKLYAKWVDVYKVILNYDYHAGTTGTIISGKESATIKTNGEGKLSDTSINGIPTSELVSPTVEGYSFGGWYILAMGTNQGGLIEAGSLAPQRGIRIENLTTFDFADYAKENSISSSAIKIYVNWAPPYHISYNANWGDNPQIQIVDTNKDDMYVLPATDPVRPGYTFDGWFTEKTDGTELKTEAPDSNTTTEKFINGTSPTTIYAHWKEGYKITFQYLGDVTDPSNPPPTEKSVWTNSRGEIKVEDRDKVKGWMNDQTVAGHVFIGWYLDGQEITYEQLLLKQFTGPATIEGRWEEGFLITFNVNADDATLAGAQNNRTDVKGRLFKGKWPQDPTRPGYTFGGWYEDKGGTTSLTEGTDATVSPPEYYQFTESTIIYAKWTYPYTITLDADGGTVEKKTLYTDKVDGEKLPKLPTPTKDGYTFKGWYPVNLPNGTLGDTAAAEGGECKGPVTLKAVWGAPFTINLVADPGTIVPDTIKTAGTPDADGNDTYANLTDPVAPPNTATDTWTFKGWFTAASGGMEVKNGNTCTGPGTLYAQWTRTTVTNGGGTVTTSTTPNKVTAASKPAAASTPMLTAATGEFDISFDSDGGKLPDGVESTAETTNQKLATLPTPTKEGWTFQGWFATIDGNETRIIAGANGTEFKGDTAVKAKWGAPFTITFDYKGAEGMPPTLTLQTGTNGILPVSQLPSAPVWEAHEFGGWYTNPDCTGDECDLGQKFDKPTTIYAKWTETGYAITFDFNDGTSPNITRQTVNGKITGLPDPVRDGYTFDGWHISKDEGSAEINLNTFTFSEAITLYAHWTKEITVTFHHNNLTNKTTVVTTKHGEWVKSDGSVAAQFTDLLPDPEFGGHEFAGWFNAVTGGVKYSNPAEIMGDMDLYAHWNEDEVEITFLDDGEEIAKLTTVNGKIPQFPNLPNRIGYKFEGWCSTENDINTKVTADTLFSSDTTLHAKWTDITAVTPTNPVITFIVDVPTPLEGAAHFTMELTKTTGYLEQLPTLIGRDDADGWRLENGNHVDEGQLYTKDTNLYVDTAKTILITFDWNNAKDGGTSSKTTVRTDKDGKIPEDKWPDTDGKNPGYHFDNWYTEATGGTVVSKLATFKEPTTIYAHWKGPFTVTFDANGGKFPDGETTKGVETDDDGNLDLLEVAEKVPTPTREGYTKFGGWSLTKDGTEAVEPDAQPYTGAATLYAIWGPPYAIEYDAMGGEVTPTEEQKLSTEDGKFPELPVPTHPRDSFGGWYTTKDYQEGTLVSAGGDCPGAVTLYAKWTREPPYTITFEANNADATMEDPASGQPVATITLKTDDKGVLMQAPPEPTLRGGKFQGWYTKAEEGAGELISDAATRTYTDDMTLYAHWETREFTITFDFNLGAIMSNPLTITTFTTTKGKSLTFLPDTLPQAASGNYKIKGWYRVQNPVEGKDQPVTTSSTFDRDTTLYAQWELAADLPITFKYPNVTFLDAENGNALVTLEVDKDYKMSSVPPGPYKEGQTFSGWFYREPDRPDGEEKQFTKDTEVTGSLRVYPKYVGAGFTITFEPGEESELEPIKVKTTSEGRIPDGEMPSPTWEGHTFTGWFTAAEGGTKINRRTVFTQDTTVYAHWDKDDSSEPGGPDDPGEDKPGPTSPPYTITFNPNGGNLNASTTALTDLNGRLMSLPTPARTGYSFDGWFNGSERITTATVFTANTTIMAQWSTGSGGSGGNGSGDINGYAITVSNTSGGRVSVSTTYAREGDRVTVTVRPYSGYQLDRIEVTNARGYDVDLRDQGSNRYVFYMPASRVTVDAVFMELIANNGNGGNTGNTGSTGGNTGGNTNWNPGGTVTQPSGGASSGMGIFSQPVLNTVPMPYLDVHPSDWYYSSVDYMWQRQLMGGVSNNRFGPQATTSNAMVWTILARLAGVDVTSGASVWYENARSWAVSNRISDGVGPNSAVTREQLATMLWNFKGSPAVGYDLGQFGDRGQISTYQAECALSWAVANNIVTGTANRLNPRGTATRAEVAAMITRFCQNT